MLHMRKYKYSAKKDSIYCNYSWKPNKAPWHDYLAEWKETTPTSSQQLLYSQITSKWSSMASRQWSSSKSRYPLKYLRTIRSCSKAPTEKSLVKWNRKLVRHHGYRVTTNLQRLMSIYDKQPHRGEFRSIHEQPYANDNEEEDLQCEK